MDCFTLCFIMALVFGVLVIALLVEIALVLRRRLKDCVHLVSTMYIEDLMRSHGIKFYKEDGESDNEDSE